MDYSAILEIVVEIVEKCLPITLIFGLTGKLVNFGLDMIFNRKIDI